MALPFSMPDSYSRGLFSHFTVIGAQMELNQPEGRGSRVHAFTRLWEMRVSAPNSISGDY